MNTLHRYAYTSCIRPEVSLTQVFEIVQVSRRNNRLADLCGILVFDGWRFFQYIEGSEESVLQLVCTLRQDKRHHQFVELLSEPFAGPCLFRNWSMGYAVTADETLLSSLVHLEPRALIERIPELVSCIDLEP